MGYTSGRPKPGFSPPWRYRGGENIAGNDGDQQATIPTDARIFIIGAEGGIVYYTINGPAGASHGFVPQNDNIVLGPLSNLNALWINAAAGVTAHIQYFQQHTKRV